MGGWVDGWMGGWVVGWMGGWVDGCMGAWVGFHRFSCKVGVLAGLEGPWTGLGGPLETGVPTPIERIPP